MSPTSIAEEEIFQAARRIGTPDARRAYLDQACRDNGSLREQVELLLAAFDSSDNFLESPSAEIAAELPARDETISEGPGTVIGPYKLVQQIGEGGMGIVFLAEQERPVKRRVALKVIKPGMDTRQVIARFEAERQALAMMEHPNIAKVLDAGTTGAAYAPGAQASGGEGETGREGDAEVRASSRVSPSPALPLSPSASTGRPYFVMELVQGVPITEYCDQCNLTTGERLDLFVTVCQAVQHAHQKGIIHRDLKPNNVLVAIQDGRATPKIIDFGVAKAINQQLTEHTLMTAFAQIVGTPLYMSPEQAELSPLGVDTRSDIYSLGVLLYELLTGTTPFDKDRLHAAAYDELRRIIREEEPPRPSARISTLAADVATTVAERRHTDTRRLRQTVHGDLDWIVMKCLEKDRNRRYDSAGSLARDIERYLHDEPVQACPPSLRYRLKKFIRRNKVAAAFIGLLIASVAALTASNIQSRRNEQLAITEGARAQAVSDLLQEMLSSADAASGKGVDFRVRDLLDDFSTRLGSQLTDQPDAKADMHATIGRAYRSLKLAEKAQPHFEKAIELHRAEHPQSERLATVMVDGAWNLLDQQRRAEAESQANQALAIYRVRGVTGAPLFHALEILQHILRGSVGREEDAERVTQEALAVARQSGQEFPDEANLLHRYADLKIAQGKVVEAEQVARQSVDMHRRLHGDGHPETAFGLKTLARALESQHKLADAEAAVREALQIFRRQFPEDHENVHGTIYQLRTVLQARQDRTALEALDKEEALTAMQSDSPDHYVRLAELLLDRSAAADREAEARQQIVRAIEAYGRTAIDSPDDSDRRLKAVDGYVKVAELCAADPNLSQECEEVQRKLTAELAALRTQFRDSPRVQEEVGYKYRSWAMAINHNRKYSTQCERAHREAIKVLAELSQANPRLQNVWFGLANSYAAVSDLQRRLRMEQDAEATARQALEIYQQHAAEIAKASTGIANLMVTDYFRLARLVPTNFSQVDSEEAHRFIDYVIDEYRQIIVNYPDNLDRHVGALTGYSQVVGSCAGAKGFEVEVGDLNRRLELELPKLLAAFPNSGDCQWHTAMIYREWATQIYPFGRYLAQAEQALAQSLDILNTLARSEPNRPRVRVFVGDGHFWLGDALWRLGRRDDAGNAFRQAIDIFDEQWAAGATDWTPGDFFGISVAYVRLAEFLASTGREDEAAKLVATAALILEREKNPLYVSDGLFGLAMGRLSLGDLAGYRDACHTQYALPVDNANDDIRARRLWSWCLGPQAGQDLTEPLRAAEEFVKHNLLDLPYCDLLMLGAMYLRAGKYEQAAGCLNDSIASFPSEPPFGAGDVIFPKLFLAMTHWQQDRRDDARQLLAETLPAIETFCNSPDCPWFGRMQLAAIRREAEAMIGLKEAEEAAKADSGANVPTTNNEPTHH